MTDYAPAEPELTPDQAADPEFLGALVELAYHDDPSVTIVSEDDIDAVPEHGVNDWSPEDAQ